jgi:hypothetical protein
VRLWTIHPRYLDAKGLVAAWREALLAQKVLAGKTQGYTCHPQLKRFQDQPAPRPIIAAFLTGIAEEAQRRGYTFDASKISGPSFAGQLEETRGQLLYEWKHLRSKLRKRAPHLYRKFKDVVRPEPHPLFRIIPGNVQPWEKRKARTRSTLL